MGFYHTSSDAGTPHITGSIFRRIEERDQISFDSTIACSNVTGSGVFGFSGQGNIYKFSFESGRIIDPDNNFVFSYISKEDIRISGNLNDTEHSYYINEKPFQLEGTKSAFNVQRFFADADNMELSLDLDVFSNGLGDLTVAFDSPIDNAKIVNATVTNVGSGTSFDIFSGYFHNPYERRLKILDFPAGVTDSSKFRVSGSGIFPIDFSPAITLYTSFGQKTISGIAADRGEGAESVYIKHSFANLETFSEYGGEVGVVKTGNAPVDYFVSSYVAPSGEFNVSLSYYGGYTGEIQKAITGVSIHNPGSGYLYSPRLTIAGDGTGAAVSLYGSRGGQVTGIKLENCGSGYSYVDIIPYQNITDIVITSSGSGYLSEPEIFVSATFGDSFSGVRSGDNVYAQTIGDKVSTIDLLGGYIPTGYTSKPNVQVKNCISGIQTLFGGYDYSLSNPPSISFVGGGGNYATGRALLGLTVTGVELLYRGSGYAEPPDVFFVGDRAALSSTRLYSDPRCRTSIDSSGHITGIEFSREGRGWFSQPEVVFKSSGISAIGATATALMGRLHITGVQMLSHGHGYDSRASTFVGYGGAILGTVMSVGATAEVVLSKGLSIRVLTGNFQKSFTGVWDLSTGDHSWKYLSSGLFDGSEYYNPTGVIVSTGLSVFPIAVSHTSFFDDLESVALLTISGSGVTPLNVYVTGKR